MPHYSLTQIAKALETYHDLRSVARTVQRLGYPTRSRRYAWIREEVRPRGGKRKHGRRNTPKHPRRPPANVKLEAIRRCFETGEKPVVHTDRGCHYRLPGWINRMRKAGLARSMSRKGCSPDNSACEGFFGITKNETFYNRDLAGVTRKELDDYLKWFRSDRIKMNLGGMSPDNYRKSLRTYP